MSNNANKYTSVPQGGDISEGNRLSDPENGVDNYELQSLESLDYENTNLEGGVGVGVDVDGNGNGNDTFDDTETGKSDMKMAFMNMANSILGAGIIGQPFAFKNSGLVGGLVVMSLLTYLIDWTLRLIVVNAKMSGTKSYQDFTAHCFGKPGRFLLLFSVGSFAYGGCMAFCVIIGDTIPHVLKAFIPGSITNSSAVGWLFHRNTIITIFTTCISYPLSLNRDISKLAKASGFALFGMTIIVILTVIRGPFVDSSLKGSLNTQQWTINHNIFQGISVISFALVCHHNTTFIYNSLQSSVKQKFNKLTHIVCVVSMIFCTIMAVNGMVNFGDNVKGNILNNFKSDDNWINVARFCFGLNMLTTFPLEIFVVRDGVKDIVYFFYNNDDSNNGNSSHFELSSRQHFFITTFLVFSSMAVSLLTCNLGIILELIGATLASLMAYIIPPLCYLKLSWSEVDYSTMKPDEKRSFILTKVLPTCACALFGAMVMIISSFMTISASISGNEAPDHCVVD